MIKRITAATIVLAIAFLTASCQSSSQNPSTPSGSSSPASAGKPKFFCAEDRRGTPTTYGINGLGREVPVIRWESEYFAGSGWSPRARCEHVSDKFVEADRQGILNYITTGIENKLPVVCVSSFSGGRCQVTLFTLKPDANASQVIEDLFDVNQGSGPLTQRPNDAPYIDFEKFLNSREPE